MTEARTLTGRVIRAEELNALIGTPTSLKEEADRIIKRAEQAAAKARQIAEAEREKLDSYLKNISDDELKKFIDVESAKSATASFIASLDAIAQMKRDFDEMLPWLVALVETSLRRLIGELTDDELFSRIVAQALIEIDPGRQSSLRAGVSAFPKIRQAQRQYPERFNGIARIDRDASIGAEELYLECKVGCADIGINAQIASILSALSEVPKGSEE